PPRPLSCPVGGPRVMLGGRCRCRRGVLLRAGDDADNGPHDLSGPALAAVARLVLADAGAARHGHAGALGEAFGVRHRVVTPEGDIPVGRRLLALPVAGLGSVHGDTELQPGVTGVAVPEL